MSVTSPHWIGTSLTLVKNFFTVSVCPLAFRTSTFTSWRSASCICNGVNTPIDQKDSSPSGEVVRAMPLAPSRRQRHSQQARSTSQLRGDPFPFGLLLLVPFFLSHEWPTVLARRCRYIPLKTWCRFNFRGKARRRWYRTLLTVRELSPESRYPCNPHGDLDLKFLNLL